MKGTRDKHENLACLLDSIENAGTGDGTLRSRTQRLGGDLPFRPNAVKTAAFSRKDVKDHPDR